MTTVPEWKYPLVQIVWHDAKSDDEWQELDHEFELPTATSIGWLIQEDDEKYVVASGRVWEDPAWLAGPWDIIPKGMVIDITEYEDE